MSRIPIKFSYTSNPTLGFPSAKPNFGATLTPKLTPETGLTLTEGFDQSDPREV